jgi:hypothetical protein
VAAREQNVADLEGSVPSTTQALNAASDEEPTTSIIARVGKGLVPTLGVLTAVTYALLRGAYVQFYYGFNVTPEEVGLGKTELLSQALVGPTLIFLTVLVLVTLFDFLVTTVEVLGTSLWGRILGRQDSAEQDDPSLTSSLAKSVSGGRLLVIASFIIAYLVLSLYSQAQSAVRDVVNRGVTITDVHAALGRFAIPLLNIVAYSATVEWKEKEKTPALIRERANCVLYLGKSNGTTIVYNVGSQKTIRFPSDDAVVSVEPTVVRLERGCYTRH